MSCTWTAAGATSLRLHDAKYLADALSGEWKAVSPPTNSVEKTENEYANYFIFSNLIFFFHWEFKLDF